jgi:hypothetical protein
VCRAIHRARAASDWRLQPRVVQVLPDQADRFARPDGPTARSKGQPSLYREAVVVHQGREPGQRSVPATGVRPPVTTASAGLVRLAALQPLAGNKAIARLLAPPASNTRIALFRSVEVVGGRGTEALHRTLPSNVVPRPQTTVVQRAPDPGSDVPARADIEKIRDRALKRNDDLAAFLRRVSETSIPRLRTYYAGLNGLYEGKYDVFTNVVTTAGKKAQSQQQLVNFLWGAVSAIAISAIAEIAVPAEAFAAVASRFSLSSAAVRTAALNVGSNVPSSGVSTFITPYTVPGLNVHPTDSLNPAFKQIAALQQIDRVSSLALGMASPAPQGYANTAVAAERIIGELRVRESRGAREQSDAQLNQVGAQLRQVDEQAAGMDESLAQVTAKIGAVDDRAGRDLPTGARVEYDMWITWIAALTDADGGWYAADNLNNSYLKKHFMEIGLDNELGVGGKLDKTPFLDPRGWHWDVDMKLHAERLMSTVNDRWHRYLLLDETS